MRQLTISIIENLSLLLVLAYAIGRMPLNVVSNPKIGIQVLIGLLFAAAVLISMNIPVNLSDGVFYDSRAIFIALSGPFGGYLAPLIAGAIAAGYRIYLGGAGTVSGLVSIALPVLLGLILVKFPLKDDRRLRFSKLALCGLAIGILTAPTTLFLPDKKLGLELLQTFILTLPFIMMVIFPVSDAILNAQTWHLKNRKFVTTK